MQPIKIRHGNQVRRDTLEGEITIQALQDTFAQLFGRPLQGETLRYKDDDSDWVDISTERELREALRITQGKTLELAVSREEGRHFSRFGGRWRRESGECPRREGHPHPPHHHGHRHGHFPPPPPFFHFGFGPHGHHPLSEFVPPQEQQGFRHPARCDNCEVQIVGLRHKCDVCPDYDLCASCIGSANQIHPEHAFTCLEKSFPRWHHCHAEKSQPQEEVKEEQVVDATVLVEDEVKNDIEEQVPEQKQEDVEDENEETVEEAQEEAVEDENEEHNSERNGLDREEIVRKLQQLEAMGFSDRQVNTRLILAWNGDMNMVMEDLLNQL